MRSSCGEGLADVYRWWLSKKCVSGERQVGIVCLSMERWAVEGLLVTGTELYVILPLVLV